MAPEDQIPPEPAAAPAPKAAPAPRRGLPRWLKITLLSVGGLLGTLIVAFLIVGFVLDLGGIVKGRVDAMLPDVQKQIGRTVRVGKISLKLLPTTRARIEDVVVEAQPGQTGAAAEPLLKLRELRAKVALVPLVFSLGTRVRIEELAVDGTEVQVVRFADDRLSYQDILDKLAEQPESPPMTQDQIDRLAGIVCERASLTGAVKFYDLGAPGGAAAPVKIDSIALGAKDAQLFAPFPLTLDMAVLTAAQNFHLGLTVGPMPRDLRVTEPLAILKRAELKIQPIQIEPLLRFLPPPVGLGVARALVEADLLLETPAQAGELTLKARFAARGMVLEDGAILATGPAAVLTKQGKPSDVSVQTELKANFLTGDVLVQKLELLINDMSVSGNADLRTLWSTPAVNALSLSSRGVLLDKLMAVMPKGSLPKDLVAEGPLVVRGAASGTPQQAKVEVGLDLTGASLRLPALVKPAGTKLALELQAQLAGKAVDIERFGLTLGPLALLLHGTVRAADDFDLKIDSGSVDLDQLLRLLPTVQKGVPAKTKIDGNLRIAGNVRSKGQELTADAKIKMDGAKLAQGDIDLLGSAALTADVKSTPASASVRADLDLTGAKLRVPGSVDKDRGVPMRMRLQAERTARLLVIKQGELELPGGTIRVNGKADLAGNQLDVKIPLVDLDLSKLSSVLPALRQGAMGGFLDSRIKFAAAADGNPNKLSTVHAKVDPLEMYVAGGNIKGSADVVGVDEPKKITFDFRADRVDLDRLLPDKGGESEAQPERKSAPWTPPRLLRKLEMNGRVQVDSGKYKGSQLRDFLLEVTMSGGKLLIKTLRASALGGSVMASGSTVDFNTTKPKFALRAKLDKIEVSDVLALKSGGDLSRKLSGKGSMDLSADGQGLEWADIAPKVSGLLGLGITSGKLETAGLGGAVVAPLLARLPNVGNTAASVLSSKDLSMKDLAASLRIQDGKLNTTTPIKLTTEQGALNLTGSIGLDKSLALLGNLDLSPQAVSAATGGKIVPDVPVPVALRIGGTLSNPQFSLADPVRTVSVLTAAVLRGRGADLLKGAGAGALGGVLGNALGGAKPAAPAGAQPAGAPPTQGAAPAPATPKQNLQDAATKGIKRGLGGLLGR